VTSSPRRCPWPTFDDPLYRRYHDTEWGVPVRQDRRIYEFLVLEAFQAGLSWRTVLHKRANFRRAFAGFDVQAVAQFRARDGGRNSFFHNQIIGQSLKERLSASHRTVKFSRVFCHCRISLVFKRLNI